LQPYRMMICASPSYIARAGIPKRPEDLAGHSCLGFTMWSGSGGWSLGRTGVRRDDLPTCRFQSNNGQALLMAALRGAGIVMQSEVMLADDVAAGRLVQILSDFLPPPRPMHVIYARDRQATPKLTTFIAFLVERFGARNPLRRERRRSR